MQRNETWIYLLTKTFENATLYNYALSGATSFGVKDYQMEDLQKDNIQGNKLIFVWVGANDATRFLYANFTQNYKIIVDELTRIPNATVILLTIPDASKLPVATEVQQDVNQIAAGLGFNVTLDVKQISKEVILTYNQAVLTLAHQHDLKAIDIFTYMATFNSSWISQDKFHPNALGHQMIMEKVKSELVFADREYR